MNYSIFHSPGVNARVAIAVDNENSRASIAFLAKGRSRRSDGTYVPRNPERRALFDRVCGEIGKQYDLTAVAASGGKSSEPTTWIRSDELFGCWTELLSVYRGSGNYRMDLEIDLNKGFNWTAKGVAFHLLLEPLEGVRAPKEVRWIR